MTYWCNVLEVLISRLPMNGKWSAAVRRRWLYALEKLLDLYISVEEDPAFIASQKWRGLT